jgi:hypothetical protein
MSNYCFDIDNNELVDLTKQKCFILGYELAFIKGLIDSGQQVKQYIHFENKERIKKLCVGLDYKLTWSFKDVSEAWMLLEVNQ